MRCCSPELRPLALVLGISALVGGAGAFSDAPLLRGRSGSQVQLAIPAARVQSCSGPGLRGWLSALGRGGGRADVAKKDALLNSVVALRGGEGEDGAEAHGDGGAEDTVGPEAAAAAQEGIIANHTREGQASNTEGGCPHGRHSDNPEEAHCMECEVMAFLQRAAGVLQQAGGRMESTEFARQWTELFPEDPLTPEQEAPDRQVATSVGGVLRESGYFHVEDTPDPKVKLFELIETTDDPNGLGDTPPSMCLRFELPPPEKDSFVDAARAWLAMTGVGRHPGVGSGRLTQDDLASLIAPTTENEKRKRHDEVQYKGKWGEPLVGYWTLGACDGSNGCVHKERHTAGALHHWTCCGSQDIASVFCDEEPE